MAYQGKNKVGTVAQAIAGPRLWTYTDTGSALSSLPNTNFFSDGRTLGMKVGDTVRYTNTVTPGVSRHYVVNDVQAQDTGVQFANVGDTN